MGCAVVCERTLSGDAKTGTRSTRNLQCSPGSNTQGVAIDAGWRMELFDEFQMRLLESVPENVVHIRHDYDLPSHLNSAFPGAGYVPSRQRAIIADHD